MSKLVYRYETEAGEPLKACPDCSHSLARPGGIALLLSIAGRVTEVPSRLDAAGRLVDTVDGAVASGFHSATECKYCGLQLVDYEVVEYEAVEGKEVETRGGYNDLMPAAVQVEWEEKIAAVIFDRHDVETSEETAGELGRRILYLVLRKFRPDLCDDEQPSA